MFLVRRVVSVVLLLIVFLLGPLLIVWQDDTRDETNMSTLNVLSKTSIVKLYNAVCLYLVEWVGYKYWFTTHDR